MNWFFLVQVIVGILVVRQYPSSIIFVGPALILWYFGYSEKKPNGKSR
jgi:hypothetical protein